MTKTDLHKAIAEATDTVDLTVDDFISVYGNDRKQYKKNADYPDGKELSNADILARVYNCSVTLSDNTYTFTKL